MGSLETLKFGLHRSLSLHYSRSVSCLPVYVSWSSPYQVLHVSDGFAALKMVRTLISQLILLDYLLPDMDGLECLDRL